MQLENDSRCTPVRCLELREKTFSDPCQRSPAVCRLQGLRLFFFFLPLFSFASTEERKKNHFDQKKINRSRTPFTIQHLTLVLLLDFILLQVTTMI